MIIASIVYQYFNAPKLKSDRNTELLFAAKLLPKSTSYKTKWAVKIFHQRQVNREVKVPILDAGGAFKDYGDLYTVQLLSTDLANMDANALNYWLMHCFGVQFVLF